VQHCAESVQISMWKFLLDTSSAWSAVGRPDVLCILGPRTLACRSRPTASAVLIGSIDSSDRKSPIAHLIKLGRFEPLPIEPSA
jgi:hypothetical protein